MCDTGSVRRLSQMTMAKSIQGAQREEVRGGKDKVVQQTASHVNDNRIYLPIAV